MLDQLIAAVRSVAQTEVMPRFLRVGSTRKADGTLFTEADLASQNALQKILSDLSPYPVLGEEMSEEEQKKVWETGQEGFWCIDPIDGTTNFVHGLPYFAISVGLMRHGRSEMGVVYNPVSNEMFYAERGRGAYLNGTRLPLKHHAPAMSDAIAGIEVKWLRNGRLPGRLATLAPYGSQRNLGASTLDWCYIAAGRYDVYLHGGQRLWDYAAGSIILEEAGGSMSTLDGEDYWKGPIWERSVIAALDPSLFKQWKQWVKQNS